MVATAQSFYAQLVTIGEKYLGPAGERFVRRQIDFHLSKSPEAITRDDLSKLAGSIEIALNILTKDQAIVDSAVQDIKSLAGQGRGK